MGDLFLVTLRLRTSFSVSITREDVLRVGVSVVFRPTVQAGRGSARHVRLLNFHRLAVRFFLHASKGEASKYKDVSRNSVSVRVSHVEPIEWQGPLVASTIASTRRRRTSTRRNRNVSPVLCSRGSTSLVLAVRSLAAV